MRKIAIIRQKTKQTIKNDGYISLAKKILQMFHQLAYYSTSSIWFYRPFSEPIPEVQSSLDLKIDFLIDNKQILINWLKDNNRLFTWMYIDKEIDLANREGHIFVSILHNYNIIGYLKVGVNRIYIHDFRRVVLFPQRVAFIYDTFVLPEYRGRNISLYAVAKTMYFLNSKNFNKVLCHIESWNRASLKIFRKAGFIEIGNVRFSKIFGVPIFLKNGYIPLTSIKSILV